MWLIKPPEYTTPVLVVHPEHIADRLREGWRACPDPTATEPTVDAAPDAPPAPISEQTAEARGDIPLVSLKQPAARKGKR